MRNARMSRCTARADVCAAPKLSLPMWSLSTQFCSIRLHGLAVVILPKHECLEGARSRARAACMNTVRCQKRVSACARVPSVGSLTRRDEQGMKEKSVGRVDRTIRQAWVVMVR
ncbi:uncharacterized protein L969DRAFT_45274 [Mixia osmundae IAM 14324]|uniref:Uncharacterized protein n=1 Tax=Mixia osmundae (strain CBS 9802 / IAM 14324 / JCM 22182 / KY 12970) TaxID=764103 RepID=G7DXJ8_MIXOS|nr:uncharacterized protein L969DRAFT_45274 [Mixia osmundae IAM 14324]KEI41197.1 hypothetical protein L969DRAFT_45274 [Mixia osmundae IAM 14324]GAA95308.1 hypothetical protein E5Q_01965 [Mixia osmundae IAM 14324]